MVVVLFCEACLSRRAEAEEGLEPPLQLGGALGGRPGLIQAQFGYKAGVEPGVGCERRHEAFRGWMFPPVRAEPKQDAVVFIAGPEDLGEEGLQGLSQPTTTSSSGVRPGISCRLISRFPFHPRPRRAAWMRGYAARGP
jgi:hypothetical protein